MYPTQLVRNQIRASGKTKVLNQILGNKVLWFPLSRIMEDKTFLT